MKDVDRRIARARELAIKYPESAKLLDFYRELTLLQKRIFADFGSEADVRGLAAHFPALFELVESAGPDPLKRFAQENLRTLAPREELLLAFWRPDTRDDVESEGKFFARVLLQPYAEYSRSSEAPILSRNREGAVVKSYAGSTCPFCSSRAVVGVLRGEGDGGKRSLICSLCAAEWPYRRIICPNCGEEHKNNLPVYVAEQIDHIRVEACDTCRTYLKSVDLTKNGFAVPQVDELGTVALNLWAEEHDYRKIETNLLGM